MFKYFCILILKKIKKHIKIKVNPSEGRPRVPDNSHTVKNIGRTCATCQRDISEEVYIKCLTCKGFNQCMECFSVGNESRSHLRTHPFMVVEPVLNPIFEKNWSAEEEILLLSAIQKCGFGNWSEISGLLKTKTSEECKAHYFNTFLYPESAPKPEDIIHEPSVIPPPPAFDTTPRESLPSIAQERNLAEINKKERTTPAEFAGFMPMRNEFEAEYQNDAESMINGIVFTQEDNDAHALEEKLKLLRQYNEVVEERVYRLDFAKEYNLLEEEFRGFGPQTRENKQLEEKLLPLSQVISKNELREFILAIEKENQIKKNLNMLQNWWDHGVMTRDEGVLYNNLEELNREDRLTPSSIEKWNKSAAMKADSAEFTAQLDRQLLSTTENNLCSNIGISPNMFLKLKDLLIREYMFRRVMTQEIAISFTPKQPKIMREIYRHLKSIGTFCNSMDEFESQNQELHDQQDQTEDEHDNHKHIDQEIEDEYEDHSISHDATSSDHTFHKDDTSEYNTEEIEDDDHNDASVDTTDIENQKSDDN